jgi:hypothetical protein
MQGPGYEKHHKCCTKKSGCRSPHAQGKVDGIENHPLHEVSPVDIRATPEVRETGGQEITIHCLWQVESKEVQHTYTQVKLAGEF